MTKSRLATFAGGCFWCTEAIFEQLKGVTSVVSGYSGGSKENASYERVVTDRTGHSEAIQITFDPNLISYKDLLYVFLTTHDPTQKDGQGHDIGSQYRSMIFYHDEEQKESAERAIKEAQKSYPAPIITEVIPFKAFYPAEGYHQDFYKNNPDSMYCRLVIDPKIQKLKKEYKAYLKTS